MPDYLPKDSAVPPTSSAEDHRYAQAFQDVAEVLRLSNDAERLTLLLSTCRNGYLTTNALFRDLVDVLGHGTTPSLLSTALFLLKQGQYPRARDPLNQATAALKIFEEKREVWADRVALREKLDRTLADQMDALARDRFRHLITNVRTTDEEHGATWDRRFYEFSQHEPSTLAELIGVLDTTAHKLMAITEVARAIAALPVEDLLFAAEVESRWPRLRDILMRNAEALALTSNPIPDDGLSGVGWQTGGRFFVLPEVPASDATSLLAGLTSLLAYLDELLRAEYKRLSATFRPNISQPPLPSPFRIDLSEPQSREIWWPAPEVRLHQFGLETPSSVRIALPQIGVPLAYFTPQNRYREQYRADLERVARTAIQAAGSRGANVIVFPEYFLPRDAVESLAATASEQNLVLIGGMEGRVAGDASMHNEVIVRFPEDTRPFFQSKQMESIYESPVHVTSQVRIFQGTRLGTFAVVICSDILEWGVLSALASAPTDLHFVFVVSMNPQPELFERCATADAARLYCHVVIANNCTDTRDPSAASSKGTLLCSPRLQPVSPVEPAFSLGLAAIGTTSPEMVIYDADVAALLTSRRQRIPGFLPFPASRIRKPHEAGR